MKEHNCKNCDNKKSYTHPHNIYYTHEVFEKDNKGRLISQEDINQKNKEKFTSVDTQIEIIVEKLKNVKGFIPSIISPNSPHPEVEEGFWIVSTPGVYTNFGGIVVEEDTIGFIYKHFDEFSYDYIRLLPTDVSALLDRINQVESNLRLEILSVENRVDNKIQNEVVVLTNLINTSINNLRQDVDNEIEDVRDEVSTKLDKPTTDASTQDGKKIVVIDESGASFKLPISDVRGQVLENSDGTLFIDEAENLIESNVSEFREDFYSSVSNNEITVNTVLEYYAFNSVFVEGVFVNRFDYQVVSANSIKIFNISDYTNKTANVKVSVVGSHFVRQ